MNDQAADLRNLMLRAHRAERCAVGPSAHLILVCGGQAGVGVTTTAVNLAVALAEHGSRTVLVDANFLGADVATYCGVQQQNAITDVLSGRRDLHEVLQAGPTGLQIIPGVWSPTSVSEASSRAQQRLVNHIKGLGRHAELVVVDVGHGVNSLSKRFWQVADDVALVTTPESRAVMDAYATLKECAGDNPALANIGLIVNRAEEDEASHVHQRMQRSCQRFLNIPLANLGCTPTEQLGSREFNNILPSPTRDPRSLVAEQFHEMASLIASRRAA